MSEIYFNNKSSKECKLLIENIIDLPTSSTKYNTVDIPGSNNGSLNIYNGLEDIQLSFDFVFKSRENFIISKSRIVSWLKSKISKELRYSLHKGIYYIVKKVDIGEFKTTFKLVRRFTVKFTCCPIVFLDEGKEVITFNKSITLYNGKSTCNTEPQLNIFGSGDITIKINNQQLILKDIENNIIVDSFSKDCYKISNNKIIHSNNKMYSDFPILEVGENNISYSGNVRKIELIPRWCCI
ncbi:UNVERIFIED_ORG: phage tail protein [Clostridium botulinum]|nr:phage tail protein [Clostridium botulinum]